VICDECGFAYGSVPDAEAAGALAELGSRYRVPLTRALAGEDLDTLLRAHPMAGTWSALEYACHVRDVLAVQRERMEQALVVDDFVPEPMGRDERVIAERYNDQDVAEVARALAAHAEALGALYGGLDTGQRERTMVYAYPEVAVRPLTWVAQHTIHEGRHHLLDIGRVLRAARGR
jgi:S-DNA-T family DNA segregation ATPase FtsK/SpoIIIE